ncbi:hypothetical protein FB451DRAFT_1177165 [Mycena latifolia]|nr:hypothetical protein FB451DRAFT_1177165 [Mycena latifolia]
MPCGRGVAGNGWREMISEDSGGKVSLAMCSQWSTQFTGRNWVGWVEVGDLAATSPPIAAKVAALFVTLAPRHKGFAASEFTLPPPGCGKFTGSKGELLSSTNESGSPARHRGLSRGETFWFPSSRSRYSRACGYLTDPSIDSGSSLSDDLVAGIAYVRACIFEIYDGRNVVNGFGQSPNGLVQIAKGLWLWSTPSNDVLGAFKILRASIDEDSSVAKTGSDGKQRPRTLLNSITLKSVAEYLATVARGMGGISTHSSAFKMQHLQREHTSSTLILGEALMAEFFRHFLLEPVVVPGLNPMRSRSSSRRTGWKHAISKGHLVKIDQERIAVLERVLALHRMVLSIAILWFVGVRSSALTAVNLGDTLFSSINQSEVLLLCENTLHSVCKSARRCTCYNILRYNVRKRREESTARSAAAFHTAVYSRLSGTCGAMIVSVSVRGDRRREGGAPLIARMGQNALRCRDNDGAVSHDGVREHEDNTAAQTDVRGARGPRGERSCGLRELTPTTVGVEENAERTYRDAALDDGDLEAEDARGRR